MGLWDASASNEPAFPELAEALSKLDEAKIKELLEHASKGSAELHRDLKRVFTYRCCPQGCCMCRRY